MNVEDTSLITIRELRAFLEEYPDDTEVTIRVGEDGLRLTRTHFYSPSVGRMELRTETRAVVMVLQKHEAAIVREARRRDEELGLYQPLDATPEEEVLGA